LFNSLI